MASMHSADPVVYIGPGELPDTPAGWYHWNETWSDLSQRYDTEAEAREGLLEYCRVVLGVPLPKE